MTRKEYEYRLDKILEYLLIEIHNSMNDKAQTDIDGSKIIYFYKNLPVYYFNETDTRVIKEFATEHCIDLSLITD